jgi:hypothetical protein
MRTSAIFIAVNLVGNTIASIAATEIERWLHDNGAQHSESIHIEDRRDIRAVSVGIESGFPGATER